MRAPTPPSSHSRQAGPGQEPGPWRGRSQRPESAAGVGETRAGGCVQGPGSGSGFPTRVGARFRVRGPGTGGLGSGFGDLGQRLELDFRDPGSGAGLCVQPTEFEGRGSGPGVRGGSGVPGQRTPCLGPRVPGLRPRPRVPGLFRSGVPGAQGPGSGIRGPGSGSALTSSKSEPTLAVTSSTAVPGAAAFPAIAAWAGAAAPRGRPAGVSAGRGVSCARGRPRGASRVRPVRPGLAGVRPRSLSLSAAPRPSLSAGAHRGPRAAIRIAAAGAPAALPPPPPPPPIAEARPARAGGGASGAGRGRAEAGPAEGGAGWAGQGRGGASRGGDGGEGRGGRKRGQA